MAQHFDISNFDESAGIVKHCRSCFRKDIHHNIPVPAFMFGFLLILTCGLFLVIRPTRCCCCGKARIL